MTARRRRSKTRTRKQTYADEELLIQALVMIAKEIAAAKASDNPTADHSTGGDD